MSWQDGYELVFEEDFKAGNKEDYNVGCKEISYSITMRVTGKIEFEKVTLRTLVCQIKVKCIPTVPGCYQVVRANDSVSCDPTQRYFHARAHEYLELMEPPIFTTTDTISRIAAPEGLEEKRSDYFWS